MRVNIDGSQIDVEKDLHKQLSEKLNFGPYYGGNLDALWDFLYRNVERPVELIWKDSEASKGALGVELFNKIAELMIRVMEEDVLKDPDDRFTIQFD